MPEDWFSELCHKHGLRPTGPLTAADLRAGHVLFTATGEPREIVSRRPFRGYVYVKYADGWEDRWTHDAPISLVAERVNENDQ